MCVLSAPDSGELFYGSGYTKSAKVVEAIRHAEYADDTLDHDIQLLRVSVQLQTIFPFPIEFLLNKLTEN